MVRFIFALFFVSLNVFAAPDMTLEGSLDVRPSWKSAQGSFHTENEIQAMLKLTQSSSAGYVQEFQTNIYRTGDGGLGAQARDGYFKGEFEFEKWLAFEPRLILPTSPSERAAGLNVQLRPIVKLIQNYEGWGVELWESPVIPFYSKNGYQSDGESVSNRVFENRVELAFISTFFKDKLAFKFPVVWQALRHAAFDGNSRYDGAWEHWVWINPELIYQVFENTGLGLAFYSDTFTGTGNSLQSGLSRGVTQVVFQESF